MRPRDYPPAAVRPRGDLSTIATLLPYLWPAGETGLRVRVVTALVCLVAAKGINVAMPFFYKEAVDALTPGTAAGAAIAVPVALIVAYGVARLLALAFGELRDGLFARVGQRAIRRAGLRTFEHLHRLSLRFHLDRRTGAVSRAI